MTMQNLPQLDRTYLSRIGFSEVGDIWTKDVAVNLRVIVSHDTGEGWLVMTNGRHPLKFQTVTHLKWFMDAMK